MRVPVVFCEAVEKVYLLSCGSAFFAPAYDECASAQSLAASYSWSFLNGPGRWSVIPVLSTFSMCFATFSLSPVRNVSLNVDVFKVCLEGGII